MRMNTNSTAAVAMSASRHAGGVAHLHDDVGRQRAHAFEDALAQAARLVARDHDDGHRFAGMARPTPRMTPAMTPDLAAGKTTKNTLRSWAGAEGQTAPS